MVGQVRVNLVQVLGLSKIVRIDDWFYAAGGGGHSGGGRRAGGFERGGRRKLC